VIFLQTRRKVGAVLAALLVTSVLTNVTSAAPGGGPVETGTQVAVDGEVIAAKVITVAGHELLPVRAVAERLGATVEWDAADRAVRVSLDGQTSLLPVGGDQATVSRRKVDLPVATLLYQDRAYAVQEYFAEALGRLTQSPARINLTGFRHPLDPLTADEIGTAVAVFKQAGLATESSRFVEISLHEPPKAEVQAFKAGDPVRREAFAVIFDPAKRGVTEAVADVGARKVVSSQVLKDVQPQVLFAEYDTVPAVIRKDPRWQAAMQKRGITDFEQVQFDIWAGGNYGIPAEQGHRVLRAVSYQVGDSTNLYARPIEGVVVYVDPNLPQVLEVIDTGVVPVSPAPDNLDDKSVGPLRTPPLPLDPAQPAGVSFKVQGHEIQWQKWHFRWSVQPRQGLVIQNVGYEDGGQVRPVLYSAYLSEMVVPYAESDETFFWRNAFDVGEYGLGKTAHTLLPGQQCPANAAFFDAAFSDEQGEPYVQANAVCVFERDGDIAWSHYESSNETTQTRRGRDLVVRFMSVVGNYDYGINWIFHQDGTIDQETDATGIVEPKGVHSQSMNEPGAAKELAHGTLVAPFVEAPYHQHFFSYRLDLDVDGARNSVVEMNVAATPAGPANPFKNAWSVGETVLTSEKQAMRDLNPAASRMWAVINPNRKDALGYPTGYVLMPGETAVPYSDPGTIVRQRSGFVSHQLWVTPYRAGERFAAGEYPNQSRGGEGLPKWTAADRPLENQDVVLWYTMGLTHITRPEDWPVMPTHRLSFSLLPAGFFDRNPALDLPGVH
jgi:primary-amine oxidase